MIYTDEVFELEDSLDELCQALLSSTSFDDHCSNKKAILNSPETLNKEKVFGEAKTAFEKIENYGDYAPDFKEKRRQLRQAKRELDLDPIVAKFRVSEHELQSMLDRLVYEMAQVISEDIKIDAGNPFFEFASKGCGGSCHVG